jgi:crotonobetainyl-CoA:carnitine CoA-transferase CaiB-like acyl-CoA transferase
MSSTFLQGIRVIEFGEVWAGPMAGSIFGDLGAEVVKVESFPRSSITRILVSPAPGPGEGPVYERSAIHHISNRNKRNIAVNVRTDEGAEILRRLIAEADVFFESYSAGTVERMGFGWEAAKAINPRLIYVSMPGWGASGPYQGYVTLGSGLDAAGGHTALRGNPERPMEDTRPIFHSDATGALALNTAVLTALHQRERTGEGVYIDISQIEVLNWHLPGPVADWAMNQRVPDRLGNSDPLIVPHGCYRTGSGEAGEESWIVIAAEDDAQWAALATAMGHPEWAAAGHAWSTITGRLGAREQVDAAIREFAASANAEELAETLQGVGVIAAPVVAPWSLLAQPQLGSRDWLTYVDHACVGFQAFPGFMWSVEPDAPEWTRACGLVGEHNAEVLSGLGYSTGEIDGFASAGVIGDRYGA